MQPGPRSVPPHRPTEPAGPRSRSFRSAVPVLARAVDPWLTERLTAERRALDSLARPLRRGTSLAVVGVQPAAGRTTVAALLSHVLDSLGGTRVLAVDTDTRSPGLPGRLGARSGGSLHAVFAGLRLEPPGPVRLPTGPPSFRWMNQHVTAGDGPAVLAAGSAERGRPFPAGHYAATVRRFGRWYRVLVTDTPPGPTADVLPGVLGRANRLVAVSTADEAGAGALRATLDWLNAALPEGRRDLVTGVLIAAPGDSDPGRARAPAKPGLPVHVLPFDAHLASDAPLDWTALGDRTRRAAFALVSDLITGLTDPV